MSGRLLDAHEVAEWFVVSDDGIKLARDARAASPVSACPGSARGRLGRVRPDVLRTSAVWPWIGAMLLLLTPFLAVAAIAASPRRLTTVIALLAVVPLAAFIWAVWALLSS